MIIVSEDFEYRFVNWIILFICKEYKIEKKKI